MFINARGCSLRADLLAIVLESIIAGGDVKALVLAHCRSLRCFGTALMPGATTIAAMLLASMNTVFAPWCFSGSPFQMPRLGAGYTLLPTPRNAFDHNRRRQIFANKSPVIVAICVVAAIAVRRLTLLILKSDYLKVDAGSRCHHCAPRCACSAAAQCNRLIVC